MEIKNRRPVFGTGSKCDGNKQKQIKQKEIIRNVIRGIDKTIVRVKQISFPTSINKKIVFGSIKSTSERRSLSYGPIKHSKKRLESFKFRCELKPSICK